VLVPFSVQEIFVRTIATVAQRLNDRNSKLFRNKKRFPAVLAMTDTLRCPDIAEIIPHLPPNCAVIYRNGDHPQRWEMARKLQTACRHNHVPMIMAGTATEAATCNASGLHLRDQKHLRNRELRMYRRKFKRHGFVIAAAHSPVSIRHCATLGINAILLSPVYTTRSHPGAASLGITKFRLWCRLSKVPVYALGGITQKTAGHLLSTNCIGIAGIDWFLEP